MDPHLFASLEEKVNPAHSAVIVVDVQNDFCATDGWMGKGCRDLPLGDIQAMVLRLEKFINVARAHQVPLIWVRCAYDDVYIGSNQKERVQRQEFGQPPCLSETWGQEFYVLKPKEEEVIVTKHRYDAFEGTNLDLILRSNGIRTLLMTGVTTECCVESASRHGFFLGYSIVMVEDCCGTFDAALQESSRKMIQEYFGVVSNSEELGGIFGALADGEATVMQVPTINDLRAPVATE